jgi:hypothetical protein
MANGTFLTIDNGRCVGCGCALEGDELHELCIDCTQATSEAFAEMDSGFGQSFDDPDADQFPELSAEAQELLDILFI